MARMPHLFTFRIKISDEDGFRPASVFARSEQQARELLQTRFSGRVEVFQPVKGHRATD